MIWTTKYSACIKGLLLSSSYIEINPLLFMSCQVAMTLVVLRHLDSWATGSCLSPLCPSFSPCICIWLSRLALFCLAIGQFSFSCQPMRTICTHSIQKDHPTADEGAQQCRILPQHKSPLERFPQARKDGSHPTIPYLKSPKSSNDSLRLLEKSYMVDIL